MKSVFAFAFSPLWVTNFPTVTITEKKFWCMFLPALVSPKKQIRKECRPFLCSPLSQYFIHVIAFTVASCL